MLSMLQMGNSRDRYNEWGRDLGENTDMKGLRKRNSGSEESLETELSELQTVW
jgi:hypothetical protein